MNKTCMSELETRLRAEEKNHRNGFPGPRRSVADLLLQAAEELERSRIIISNMILSAQKMREQIDALEFREMGS